MLSNYAQDDPQEAYSAFTKGLSSEYDHSTEITAKPTDKIYNQKLDLDCNPSDQQHSRHTKNKTQKNAKYQNSGDEVLEQWISTWGS